MTVTDVAIAHPNWGDGGSERVSITLARLFNAPLYYTSLGDSIPPDDIETQEVRSAKPLDRFGLLRNLRYMLSLQNIEALREHDIVILSGNALRWYVPSAEQVLIRYMHSLPPVPYDMQVPNNSRLAQASALFSRVLFEHTTTYPDYWIANSELVERRLELFLGVSESNRSVIYPPVDTDIWRPTTTQTEKDLFVAWGRLIPRKRLLEVARAFESVDDKRLVIAGKGPQQTEVEAIAQRNTHIEYRGYLETNELVDIVSRAEATIFAAQTESFGLVTIESMAAGTPVIGVESGFTKYQIIEGKTGVMFNQIDNLPMIINQWDGVTYDASQLRRYIRPSSRGTFERKLKDVIQRVTAKAQITSHFEEV